MALEIVFQQGRVMSPARGPLPRKLASSGESRMRRRANFYRPQTVNRHVLDPQTPFPESQRAYLLELGVRTVLMVPLSSAGQVNGCLTLPVC